MDDEMLVEEETHSADYSAADRDEMIALGMDVPEG